MKSAAIDERLLVSRSAEQAGYMPQLDGLRALAVLAVLYSHFLPESFWLFGVYWGGLGVRLFFTLSGFLITGILLRERGPEAAPGERSFLIRQFYIRRYLRLTPIYYLTLLLMVLLNIPNARDTFWWHVLYLSNINMAIHNSWQGMTAHFWSLSVEEQFYVFIPLLVLFLRRQSLVPLLVALALGSIVYRYAATLAGMPDVALWVLPPASMDALALGGLMAVGVRMHRLTARSRRLKAFAGFGLIIWVSHASLANPPAWLVAIEPTGISLFFAWLVLFASENRPFAPARLLGLRPMTYLGRISYGVYVLHNPVWFMVDTRLLPEAWGGAAAVDRVVPVAVLSVAATIGLASLSWWALESPINGFRRTFPYRRPDQAAISKQ